MRPTTSPSPSRVRETHDATVPAWVHPDWAAQLPWLVQGTTTRGTRDAEFDLGLFTGQDSASIDRVRANWNHLIDESGMRAAMHARQVHEAEVRTHLAPAPGLHIVEPCDGHVTSEAGVLLAVTVADCVPVFLVDTKRRSIGLVHAGWRGTAAGVLERGVDRMAERGLRDDLRVHLGPSICGACYEVGPEVFKALAEPVPARPTPLDLRAVLARRAVAAGIDAARVSVSEHCTRCTGSGLFSHRGGDRGRQVGYIGIRV